MSKITNGHHFNQIGSFIFCLWYRHFCNIRIGLRRVISCKNLNLKKNPMIIIRQFLVWWNVIYPSILPSHPHWGRSQVCWSLCMLTLGWEAEKCNHNLFLNCFSNGIYFIKWNMFNKSMYFLSWKSKRIAQKLSTVLKKQWQLIYYIKLWLLY